MPPFFYRMCYVRLTLCAKGYRSLAKGGKHFKKPLYYFLYVILSTHPCPMRKAILRIIRGLNLLYFSWKNISLSLKLLSGHFMGKPSFRLSEVLFLCKQPTLSFSCFLAIVGFLNFNAMTNVKNRVSPSKAHISHLL